MDFYWVMTTENEVAKLPSIAVGLPSYVRPARPWSYAIQGVPPPLVWSPLMISTCTNFTKVLHKVVLVGYLISKFVKVELT